jgi:hypothetical protein
MGGSDTIRIQLTEPLGWPAVPSFFDVFLDSGETTSVISNVSIPLDAPPWTTNAIFCTATSQTDTSQTITAWLPVQVKQYDVGPLLIESPIGTLEGGTHCTPKVWVLNSGHIDSFFDVFFEIRYPDNSLYTSDTAHVSGLAPGLTQQVAFTTLTLDEPGTFTTRAYTVLTGDADSSNDTVSGSFEVQAVTRIRDWEHYE